MGKVSISSPWVEFARKVEKLFEKDPEIKTEYNEKQVNLIIRVDNTDKYEALKHFLPEMKDFGGQELLITIIPANENEKDDKDYIKNLFKGNKSVVEIQDISGIMTPSMTFVSFVQEVVQYWNDNIGDLHGNRSTLFEQLAREVFEKTDGVFFCTDNNKYQW